MLTGLKQTLTAASAKPNVVCVLSFGRTGTNYFLSRIMSSSEILVGWEPFNRQLKNWFEFWKFPGISVETQALLEDVDLRAADSAAFFDRVSGRDGTLTGNSDVKTVLFKIFSMHNLPAYRKACQTPGVRVILIERRNVLAMYASTRKAAKTKEYIISADAKPTPQKIAFDPFEFELFVSYQELLGAMTRDLLEARGEPWLAFDYEEITSADFDFAPCFTFCGVKPVVAEPSWLKKQAGSLASTFDNMDVVHSFITEAYPQYIPYLADKPIDVTREGVSA